MRPKPLERWLWRQGISAAAERVFWFHWSEGARSGDWCSQFALHFVAQECEVDISTVTRAYQTLRRLGVLRRTDPGRDASQPFGQAIFITEVLVPGDLLAKLHALPNRPRLGAAKATPVDRGEPVRAPASDTPVRPAHPHAHLNLNERRERLRALGEALSPAERERWHQAICGTVERLVFDPNTQVPVSIQAEIQQYLAARARPEPLPAAPVAVPSSRSGARRLSVFEVARLRRSVQQLAGTQSADELSRQILWSIEAVNGSLRQFVPAHALNIALKKLREGLWTRPNRMPPNWVRALREGAQAETCSRA